MVAIGAAVIAAFGRRGRRHAASVRVDAVRGARDCHRIFSVNIRVGRPRTSRSPTRSSSRTALLFGPAPAALAIAADSLVMFWRRGHACAADRASTSPRRRSRCGPAAQAFFLIARRLANRCTVDAAVGALVVPLLLMTLVYFALNSGLTAMAVGLESRPVAGRNLAPALPVAVDRLPGVGVAGVLSHAADPAGQLIALPSWSCRCWRCST